MSSTTFAIPRRHPSTERAYERVASRFAGPRARLLAGIPDIQLDVIVEDGFVDLLASGCDAGIRYDESLAQDMVAVPIGPRVQRFAAAASPAYLGRFGRPGHPRELLSHACLRGRFASGVVPPWDFERDGESVRVDPTPRMVVRLGGGADLAVDAAVGGAGVVYLFEDWLRPQLDSGALEPVLAEWWPSFLAPIFTSQVASSCPRRCRRLLTLCARGR